MTTVNDQLRAQLKNLGDACHRAAYADSDYLTMVVTLEVTRAVCAAWMEALTKVNA